MHDQRPSRSPARTSTGASLRRGRRPVTGGGRAPGGAQNSASSPPRTKPAGASEEARKALELLTLVVAPVTLATALLFWFGFELVDARSSYFGLGTGTLGFSTTDYLVRGVEAGIVPMIVLLLLALLVVAGYVAGRRLAEAFGAEPAFRWAVSGLLVLAVGVTLAAAYSVFRPLPRPFDGYLLPPALLGAGPVVAAFAIQLVHRAWLPVRPARMAAVAIGGLLVLSAFWAASLYADALGRGRAQALANNLSSLTRVTLYSERPLGIPARVAAAQPVGEQDGAYSYRYTGLRLLIRSDDKYFLLPDSWTAVDGTALVIPDGSGVRVELSPPGG